MCQLILSTPPSVNSCYATDFRTKRRFISKTYAQWLNIAAQELLTQSRKNLKPKYKILVEVGRFKDKRRRDICNYEKPLTDFLVKYDILEDDCFIEDMRLKWSDEIEQKQLRVTIESIEND